MQVSYCKTMFRVRIFKAEHYMSAPITGLDVTYSDFRKSSIKQVPVIRVFGSTPSGDKSCVHVHGVFPYICIPYDGSEPHLKLSYQLAASLDKAINIASGYSTSNTQHVYKVILVSGIPFYGYHKKRHQYLKIYFYKPSVIKQAVQLLQNGAILNKIFEPHEAHVPFILQFFIDFNLYGMSFVDMQNVKYRKTANPDLLRDIPVEAILPDTVPALSLSKYEIDVAASDIINRPSSQGNGQIINPGLTAIWDDENRRRAMKEGTPLQAPQLHSQRPSLKSTSSETFYLRQLFNVLNNQAQPGDDSLLSGEPVSVSNKSYAIEEPANTSALDASFVSMHTQHSLHITAPFETDNLNDTIVDEELALQNMSISQRLTQTLDKSLTLDQEDLELLDVLETLADTRSVTVDDDSELGSQASRGKSVPFAIADEEHNSDAEENWQDKTLVAEEDEVMKLLDLTMPDIDEEHILREELQSGHSEERREQSNIPQVDGACDSLTKSFTSFSRRKSRKCIIPQVDGVNDLASKSVRRSLGMRGRKSCTSNNGHGKHDFRYKSDGELIFYTHRPRQVNSETPLRENSSYLPSSSYVPEELPSCSQSVQISQQERSRETLCQNGDAPAETSETFLLPMIPTRIESMAQGFCKPTKPPSEQDALVCLPPPPSEQFPALDFLTSGENTVLPSYFPFTTRNLQPSEACCSNSATCSCEDSSVQHDCVDAFIETLAKKRNDYLLRGDPSLYPEQPPEKEESLSDLITDSVPGGKCADEVHKQPACNEKSSRRSLRLASRDISQGPSLISETEADKASKTSDRGHSTVNSPVYSCPDLDLADILPGLTVSNTMLEEMQEGLFDWSSNGDASCSDSEVNRLASDSEMNRLTGALQNNRMEEILQTSPDSTEKPSIARRDEVLLYLQNQKCENYMQSCSSKGRDKDPVTDALLKRGVMAKPGRPPSQGKNLDLVKLFCSSSEPIISGTVKKSPKKTSIAKEMKKAARMKRKIKLSLAEQKRVKESSASVLDPSERQHRSFAGDESTLVHLEPRVFLEMLTLDNINAVCRKEKVGLRDKSVLPGEMDHSLKTKINISKSDILCGGKSRRSYHHKRTSRPSLNALATNPHVENLAQLKQSRIGFKNESRGQTSLLESHSLVEDSQNSGDLLDLSQESSADVTLPLKRRAGRKKGSSKIIKYPSVDSAGSGALLESSQESSSDVTLPSRWRSGRTMRSQYIIDSNPARGSDNLSDFEHAVCNSDLQKNFLRNVQDCGMGRNCEIDSTQNENKGQPCFTKPASQSIDHYELSKSPPDSSVVLKRRFGRTNETHVLKINERTGQTSSVDCSSLVLGSSGMRSLPARHPQRKKKLPEVDDSLSRCTSDVPPKPKAAIGDIALEKKPKLKKFRTPILKPDSSCAILYENNAAHQVQAHVLEEDKVLIARSTVSLALSSNQDLLKKKEVPNYQVPHMPLTTTIVRNKSGKYSAKPGTSKSSLDMFSQEHDDLSSKERRKLCVQCDKAHTAACSPRSSSQLAQKLSSPHEIGSEESKTQDGQNAELQDPHVRRLVKRKVRKLSSSSSEKESLKPISTLDSTSNNGSQSLNALPQSKYSKLSEDLRLSSSSGEEETNASVKVSDHIAENVELASDICNNLSQSKSSTNRKGKNFFSSPSEKKSILPVRAPDLTIKNAVFAGDTHNNLQLKKEARSHSRTSKHGGKTPQNMIKKANIPPIHREDKNVGKCLPISSTLSDVKSKEDYCENVELRKPRYTRRTSSYVSQTPAACTNKSDMAKPLTRLRYKPSKSKEVSHSSTRLTKHGNVLRKATSVNEQTSDACTQASSSKLKLSPAHQTALPKSLKNFKIPKKSVSCSISEFSEGQSKGDANASRVHVTCKLTGNILEKSVNPDNESDLFISLDTSDIDLHLSSVGIEDKTKPSIRRSSHSQAIINDPSASGYSLTNHLVLGNAGRKQEHTRGADELLSIDSFRCNVNDKVDHAVRLKRKLCADGDEEHTKDKKKDSSPVNEDVAASQQTPILSVDEIPKSVSHLFGLAVSPWYFWSPNISPAASHHGRFLSPPRAVSPDETDNLGVGNVATLKNRCMNNKEVIIPDKNNKHSSTIFQETFNSSLSTDQSLNALIDEEEKCSPIDVTVKLNATYNENNFGKSSQSLLDLFSEVSFLSNEERSKEEKQGLTALSPVILNGSPSRLKCHNSKLTRKCFNLNLHQKSLHPSQFGMPETRGKSGVQFTCSSQESCVDPSSSNEIIPQDKSSGESSDLPCGQDQSKDKVGAPVKGLCPLSTAFTPAQKPPSRQEVMMSLSSFNIPEIVNQEPFFSNLLDVKRKLEVGGNILDLVSKNCVHLEEFHSHIQGLKGLKMQQKILLKCHWGLTQVNQVKGDLQQLMSYHLQARKALITPLKKPPSVQEVKVWCKERELFNSEQITLTNKNEVQDGHEGGSRKDPTSQSRHSGEEFDYQCYSSPTLSTKSGNRSISQSEVIQSSTPNVHIRKAGLCGIQSPLLTPILQTNCRPLQKQTSSSSKQYLRKLVPSLLPSVVEKDEDLGVHSLESESSVVVVPPGSVQDTSIRRLFSETQFCKETSCSSFRNVSDASACEIKGINASPGFKMVLENLQSAKTVKEYQFVTILTVEIHVCTCGTLNPDPERDPIRAIFYSVWNDVPPTFRVPSELNGIIVANFNESSTPALNQCGVESFVEYASDETSLLKALISLVLQWDPDILAGFETEMQSWGYILQRASVLGLNFIQELSRIPSQKEGKQSDDFEDSNGLSGLNITGRIVLDVWRLFRSEVALQSYTFENLMYHILHQRISHHSFESLSRWWENPTHLMRWMTVQYYQLRVQGVMKLLDQLDVIGRTSELARLFGIQFFEVLSRGSQFRVESMMLRLAKPLSYIPLSPSVQQRAHMRAPECLPLIMEPESRFYSDPLIVLDFQSLYPSMIIAYNYCFSTCLGRVEHLGKSSHFEFGCSELRVTRTHLEQLKDNLTVSPCGVAFVTRAIRQGILPRMLEEILEARLAVKQSMKHHKDDHTLQRVLHARQLGLKLIANVTYGYTSANFSGRMPCIEVGDSVVSKGRETLERAISLVHSNHEWGARVVYGDTDSLFVLVPGRSRQEAFRIGAEIALAVTQDNPSPVKLKLEKVYQPSILQTKKRYVGFMYESPDQKQPIYEAKGIETVRRDGCPAVSKMLEKSLRILFETRDVSSVKNYVSRQFSKLLSGRANIQDLIYAREYRGKANYRPGSCVPALELTKRWLRHDRRAEPRIGERVPYVIVNGPPGSALIHLVRHPSELLKEPSLRYNAVYYVTRAIIPPLARCFSLIGADVLAWYADLPRKNQNSLPNLACTGLKKTISQYFSTIECVSCGVLTHGGVCLKCHANPQLLSASLMNKIHTWESTHTSITKICQSCLGRLDPIDCNSLDCPITYRRHQSSQKLNQAEFLTNILSDCGIASYSS